jgi:15-cis-phytoene synthase
MFDKTKQEKIFKKGSVTYFYSSLFFPPSVREKVATLYAFVRVADDFVDSTPQKKQEFQDFVTQTWEFWEGKTISNEIIINFINLSKKIQVQKSWIEAFLQAMGQDLYKKEYKNNGELNTYMYGSAEVIGLMMARILNLKEESLPFAALQGKAMQLINFIRDIKEDEKMGRIYLPLDDRKKFNAEFSDKNSENWKNLIRFEIEKYFEIQKEAEKGYKFIPLKFRVPIMTAAGLYTWTANEIYKNPFVVWEKKIKPSKIRVFVMALSIYLKEIIHEIRVH